MISVRFDGQRGLEHRRVEVAHRRAGHAARRRTAPRTARRWRCCARAARPRCRGSRSWLIWMSLVATRNCQPSTSSEPGEAGEQPAHRHHEHVVAADRDARGARRLRIEADGAHLEPRPRAVEQHPEHQQRRERDEDADVQALQLRIAEEHRQLRALGDVVRHRDRGVGVALQRPAEPEQEYAVQIAIQLSMIVEITSCAPATAFSRPAIAPHAAPASARGDHREQDVQQGRHAGERRADPDREVRCRRGTGPGRRC